MIKLNPLWMGLLGIGLSQTTASAFAETVPGLATSPTLMSDPALHVSSTPKAKPALLLAQTVAAPARDTQSSTVQSFERLIERYRCAPATARPSLRGQPTNRYEMAALLASCLESLGDRALNDQEQSTLATLRSEFRLELAALQGEQADSIRLRQPIKPDSDPQQPTYSFIQWSKAFGQDTLAPHQGGVSQPWLGIKAEATFGAVGLFGRYSTAAHPLVLSNGADRMDSALGTTAVLQDRDLQTWSAGIGIRGFIIPKSVLALSTGRTFTNALDQPNLVNYGAFYQFPVGDHLTLSPSVLIISNPSNPDRPEIQGAVQASFSF